VPRHVGRGHGRFKRRWLEEYDRKEKNCRYSRKSRQNFQVFVVSRYVLNIF
jgi:hypothetical protein